MRTTLNLVAGLTVFSLSASTAFAIPLSTTGKPPGPAPTEAPASAQARTSSSLPSGVRYQQLMMPGTISSSVAPFTRSSVSSSARSSSSASSVPADTTLTVIGARAELASDNVAVSLDAIEDTDSQTTADQLKQMKRKLQTDFDALALAFAAKNVNANAVNTLFATAGKDLSSLARMIDWTADESVEGFQMVRKELDALRRAWTKVRVSTRATVTANARAK